MAMASTFHRLASCVAIAGLSFSPTNSGSIIIRHHSVTQSIGDGSKKVLDCIININAIDPDGEKHSIVGLTGHTLLKSLANNDLINPASHCLEDPAICSTECEVSVTTNWLQKLPPPSKDELYVLKSNAMRGDVSKHARLGYQLILNHDLNGMVVTLLEPRPWDII